MAAPLVPPVAEALVAESPVAPEVAFPEEEAVAAPEEPPLAVPSAAPLSPLVTSTLTAPLPP